MLVDELRYGDVLDKWQVAEPNGAAASLGAAEGGAPAAEALPIGSFGSSFRNDSDDPFAWVHRLHDVPDKASIPHLTLTLKFSPAM